MDLSHLNQVRISSVDENVIASSAVSNFVTSNEITSNRYFLSSCNGNYLSLKN